MGHQNDGLDLAAERALEAVMTAIGDFPPLIRRHAHDLITRHGYSHSADGHGPHTNTLGHPLMHLPMWVGQAIGGELPDTVLDDILESSVWGYLSVRVDDDLLDGDWDDAEAAVVLSGALRSRHQALLGRHVADPRFWDRFDRLWGDYAEAMLLERMLHDRRSEYTADDFDRVLARSQPLEIPVDAVLALEGRWDVIDSTSSLVGHLVKATQLFDDFIDAPTDLEAGNFTWMVRRLGGGDGMSTLRRGMVSSCDSVFGEAYQELDRAAELALQADIAGLPPWIETRKAAMEATSQRLYQVFLEHLM